MSYVFVNSRRLSCYLISLIATYVSTLQWFYFSSYQISVTITFNAKEYPTFYGDKNYNYTTINIINAIKPSVIITGHIKLVDIY